MDLQMFSTAKDCVGYSCIARNCDVYSLKDGRHWNEHCGDIAVADDWLLLIRCVAQCARENVANRLNSKPLRATS